jgi:hypothetical protein
MRDQKTLMGGQEKIEGEKKKEEGAKEEVPSHG